MYVKCSNAQSFVACLVVIAVIASCNAVSLLGQITRITADSLKIKTASVVKILVPGDSSANVALPSTAGILAIEQGETVYPIGTIQYVLNHLSVPYGYLRADGQPVSRTDYASLYDRIGTTYGVGDGSTTFNLPTIIDPYVPRDALVGWWPFNGDGKDRWFKQNHATVEGSTLTTDRCGKADAAYNFDGVDDYMFVSNACFDNGWDAWTISLWSVVNNAANTGNALFMNTTPHTAVGVGAGSNQGRYLVGIGDAQGQWSFLTPSVTNYAYNVGEWSHVCVVRNGLNVKYYVNGVLDTEYTMLGAPAAADCQLNFGKCDCYLFEYLTGKLDDIGIWSRALTQEEITALYRSSHYAVIRVK